MLLSRHYHNRIKDFPRLEIGLLSSKPHFTTVIFSDTHIGHPFTRANRLARILQQLSADLFLFNGDIIDGAALQKQKISQIRRPSDLRALSAIQTIATETPTQLLAGNHDPYLFKEKRKTYKIGEITLRENFLLYGGDGRRFLIEHGHTHDLELTGKVPRGFWSRFGDDFISSVERADAKLQESIPSLVLRLSKTTLSSDFHKAAILSAAGLSFARAVKGTLRDKILDRMTAHHKILSEDTDCDGRICGHTHMEGFWRTDSGKLVMNSGDSTFYPKALVQDKNGLWAHITFMPKGLLIQTENLDTYTMQYRELGLKNPYLPHIKKQEHRHNREEIGTLVYAACGGDTPPSVFHV